MRFLITYYMFCLVCGSGCQVVSTPIYYSGGSGFKFSPEIRTLSFS
jgi:hypothetical protein